MLLRLIFHNVVRQPHVGFQGQGGTGFLATDGGAKYVLVLTVHVAPAGVGRGEPPVDVAVAFGVAVQNIQKILAPR